MALAEQIRGTPYVLADATERPSEGVDSVASGGGLTVTPNVGAVVLSAMGSPKYALNTNAFSGSSDILSVTVTSPTLPTDLVVWSLGSAPVGTVTLKQFNPDAGGGGTIDFVSTSLVETAKLNIAVFPAYTSP